MDRRYYGRLASAPFSMSQSSFASFETHFTVSWYGDAGDGASPEGLLNAQQLRAAVEAEGRDWDATELRVAAVLHDMLQTAGEAYIGHQPDSRALYGVDIMFDSAWQPHVLECNFAGDLQTVLRRVPGGAPAFVNDVAAYLFCGEAAPELRRL